MIPGIQEKTDRLCERGIVAVVRADTSGQLLEVARALLAGGVDCIEITMTTPNALEVIARCRAELDQAAMVGVGSVLEREVALAAIAAGAEFVVSPVLEASVIAAAHQAGLPAVAGAFTPNEILAAARAGADLVKVFPATRLGPGYFKDVLAPMPFLKLTPTGGVDLTNAGAFIKAGAVTLGVGSALVPRKAVWDGDFAQIQRLAAEFVAAVKQARGQNTA
jgi:2-dehydro-3-deoxyphosphogluconate aldolase/(4S)-4-hydroxy-2-oxoglutarate aldolase